MRNAESREKKVVWEQVDLAWKPGAWGWTSEQDRQRHCGMWGSDLAGPLPVSAGSPDPSPVMALVPQYSSSLFSWVSPVTSLAVQLLVLFLPNQKPTRGQSFGDSWCI